MKPWIYISGTFLTLIMAFPLKSLGQNEDDALRYAQTHISGTARSAAMGGAFGALGSDFSSLSINPAGLGLYRRSEFSFSPAITGNSIESNYLGGKYKDDKYQFHVSNLGMVMAGERDAKGDKWKGLGFGFGYNRLANFSNRYIIQGNNASSSLTDVYLAEAKSLDPSSFPTFGTDMAWNTYLIDTLKGEYFSAMPANISKIQRKSIEKSGGIGETVLSFAGNYNNQLFIGATVGFQKIRYWEESNYSEAPTTDTFAIKGFTVNNYLNTDGNGVNIKFGLIYMPIPFVRIGAAFHSPTYFNLHDNFSSGMTTSFNNGGGTFNAGSNSNGGDDKGSFDYSYYSPMRTVGSLAFIFGQTGLLSVDYELMDYRDARFRASGYSFMEQNNSIRDKYRATGNLRVGTEIRFNPFSLRLGYALYGSPFKDQSLMSSKQHISGGIGYRHDGLFIDLAYVRTMFQEKYYLYNSYFNPNPSINQITSGSIMLTIGTKF